MPKKKRTLAAIFQAPAELLSPVAGEVSAGSAGLYDLFTGGDMDSAARRVGEVRKKFEYKATDPRAKRVVDGLRSLLQPVAQAEAALRMPFQQIADPLAKFSPAAATAISIAPDALMSAFGGRQAVLMAPEARAGLAGIARRTADAPTMGSPGAQLGMFAGKGAKTADLNRMAVAEQRLAAGHDPREVWRDEGWMRGPDGQMRFEIDDSRSSADFADAMEDFRFAGVDTTQPTPLGGMYDHPALYEAYPAAANVDWRAFPAERMRGAQAAYAEQHNALTTADNLTDANARSWVGHEMQHHIQGLEDFARGGNMRGMTLEEYLRLAGEAEARAVQKRLDYTQKQRREIYPLDDYDVPIEELILRGRR